MSKYTRNWRRNEVETSAFPGDLFAIKPVRRHKKSDDEETEEGAIKIGILRKGGWCGKRGGMTRRQVAACVSADKYLGRRWEINEQDQWKEQPIRPGKSHLTREDPSRSLQR